MRYIILVTFCFYSLTFTAQNDSISTFKNLDLITGQYVLSFIVEKKNKEIFIENCFKIWKDPISNEYGRIKWEGKSIPEIGENLYIKLIDGYKTKIGQFSRIDVFKSERHKKRILSSMNEDRSRYLSITLFDKSGNSYIWDDDKIAIMKKYLLSVIK